MHQTSQGGQAVAPKRVDLFYNLASELDLIVRYDNTTGGSLVAFSDYTTTRGTAPDGRKPPRATTQFTPGTIATG
jgi:hypothetical protein